MEKSRIVVVGSCNMDFISYAPRLPLKGETIHGTRFETSYGGKGANQCVAAAKLGGKTQMIARVGEDIWGDKYIENLQKQKVDVTHVKKTPNFSSGIAQINVADSGDNQIVIVVGANTQLSEADVEAAREDVEAAQVLLCQLETSWQVAVKAMEICKGTSIFNGAPALKEFDKRLLTLPTIFCVNETEASIFANLPVENEKQAADAAVKLIEMGCNSVIITLGAEGALYLSKDFSTPFRVKSRLVEAIDTTGAGDAFIGALAYLIAYRKDLSIVKQIELACFVASDSVTRPGTQISFPSADVLQLF